MGKNIQNKDRIKETRENLEKLLVLLKKAENDEVTLAEISKECGMLPQNLNTELQSSFVMYFKSRIRTFNKEDLDVLVDSLDSPADRLLKKIFKIEASQKVVFPDYDKSNFWVVIKNHLPSKYFDIMTKYLGYGCEPMSYSSIGEKLNLTRVRVKQIVDAAITKLSNSSVITEIFYKDYIDKIAECEQYKNKIEEECDNAYNECVKLQSYLELIPDIKELNNYISKKYSNLINVNVNTLVSDVFSKPIESLNFSVRTNNALTSAGYTTLNDLYNIEVADLFSIKNLGKSSIQEIVDVLDNQKATHPKWKTLKESITKML